MKTRIRIQIVPTRLGCWSVWVDGWRIIRSTRDPLVEIAARLIDAGHRRDARIWMIKTPDGGPCTGVATLGDAATADATGLRFREPEWRNRVDAHWTHAGLTFYECGRHHNGDAHSSHATAEPGQASGDTQ